MENTCNFNDDCHYFFYKNVLDQLKKIKTPLFVLGCLAIYISNCPSCLISYYIQREAYNFLILVFPKRVERVGEIVRKLRTHSLFSAHF